MLVVSCEWRVASRGESGVLTRNSELATGNQRLTTSSNFPKKEVPASPTKPGPQCLSTRQPRWLTRGFYRGTEATFRSRVSSLALPAKSISYHPGVRQLQIPIGKARQIQKRPCGKNCRLAAPRKCEFGKTMPACHLAAAVCNNSKLAPGRATALTIDPTAIGPDSRSSAASAAGSWATTVTPACRTTECWSR